MGSKIKEIILDGLGTQYKAPDKWIYSSCCGTGIVLFILIVNEKKTEDRTSCAFVCFLLLFDRYTDNDGDLVYVGV